MIFGRNIPNTLEYRVCMLQFLCRFAFLSTFPFSNRTPKITQILKITSHSACQHGAFLSFSKEDKILIKSLYECKGYNAQQFITDKGWTKNSINRLLVKLRKFRTVLHVIFVTSGDAI